MFPNQNQGQSQPPINLYRPGTGPQAPQGPAVQGPSMAPKMSTQFMGNKKSEGSKTIIIFVLAVATAVFAGLFVWKFLDWSSVNSTIDYKVEQQIADKEREIGEKVEAQCEAEKNAEKATFSGPNVYGSLSFLYPKIWSVYIEKEDSSKNGDFNAYINPSGVGPIAKDSVFALRIKIENVDFDKATASYKKEVEGGTMTSQVVTINNAASDATVFTKTDGSSKIVVFNIPNHNQVATIQTDSVKNFGSEFQEVLDSIKMDN